MVNREDRLRRHVIMSLICELSLDTAECEREFGIVFQTHFAAALRELGSCFADGLLRWDAERLLVTERGRPFLRNICMPFDQYLQHPQSAGTPRYSATV